MSEPVLLDLSHTSHTRARTGIQRVARAVSDGLGPDAIPITFDPYRRAWRRLKGWERANLAARSPAAKRGARWPWPARWSGRIARWTQRPTPTLPSNGGLIVPELFSPGVAAALATLTPQCQGPRIALFHDAIALRLPEFTPAKTVARFPAYLRELLQFDGIAAISDESRLALQGYWDWLGVRSTPPIETIYLGADAQPAALAPGAPARPPERPVVLCVASIEGRKNHLTLLEACEQLWLSRMDFELRLIGLGQRETGGPALDRIGQLRAAGRPLRYDGPLSDDAIEAAYDASAFTVYPSVMEGFGLPVLESLAHGRPCICSGRGALGEAARHGGCLTLETVDAPSLAAAIARLLTHPAERARLAAEAAARPQRTWADYVRDLSAWMDGL